MAFLFRVGMQGIKLRNPDACRELGIWQITMGFRTPLGNKPQIQVRATSPNMKNLKIGFVRLLTSTFFNKETTKVKEWSTPFSDVPFLQNTATSSVPTIYLRLYPCKITILRLSHKVLTGWFVILLSGIPLLLSRSQDFTFPIPTRIPYSSIILQADEKTTGNTNGSATFIISPFMILGGFRPVIRYPYCAEYMRLHGSISIMPMSIPHLTLVVPAFSSPRIYLVALKYRVEHLSGDPVTLLGSLFLDYCLRSLVCPMQNGLFTILEGDLDNNPMQISMNIKLPHFSSY
ncbi:predicted protein [Sclerotinia sclerotiorum 1980 UF-70]|uniref:Uncharacterized protein n=1 Tax=Sclerotinia sclerotiorum (strain ATCC 18683 / 1980 / Ss-1) TaxID=665079 RepID=A7F7G8_SCLS1|nr:predicted protein [Sclerotinia sclerotiorum 1980 UF-70]EDN98689.1 predicted protein [Sclerotinia sclerotiorum 1980 UF-70]